MHVRSRNRQSGVREAGLDGVSLRYVPPLDQWRFRCDHDRPGFCRCRGLDRSITGALAGLERRIPAADPRRDHVHVGVGRVRRPVGRAPRPSRAARPSRTGVLLPRRPPEHRDEVLELSRQHSKNFEAILEGGIADGSIADCDVRMTGNAIMGSINWIPKWFHGDAAQAGNVVSEFPDVLTRGLEVRG